MDEADLDDGWRDADSLAFAPETASSPRFQALEPGLTAPPRGRSKLSATSTTGPGKAAPQVCAKCGAKDAGDARFCRSCGAPLRAKASGRAGGRGVWLLLGGAVVAGVAAWATVVTVGDRWPFGAAPNAPTQPPPRAAPETVTPPAPSPPPPAASPPAVTPPQAVAAVETAPAEPAPKPAPSGGLRISDPVWLQRPTDDQLAAAYPDQAEHLGLDGEATLDCTVRADGRLTGCVVLNETPAKRGFARAALKLSSHMRVARLTKAGAPTAGRLLRVPIRWRLEE
jgi:TonB family protein